MFPLAFSAGPNNILCASSGVRFGIRKTIPFIVGINTSILIYSVLIGLGIQQLLTQVPWLLTVIKYLGSAYIFYLGWSFFKSKNSAKEADENNFRPGYFSGVAVSLLNPKLIYALIIMFSRFSAAAGADLHATLVLTLLVIGLSASAHFTWLLGGNFLARSITSPKAFMFQNRIFGGILFLVAVWMLF
jgi:threonine/homoserine/homoserine lactone efflux protein